MVFFFRNTCREEETSNVKTEIVRQRVSQCSEPSSRRGSIGVSIGNNCSRSICLQTAVTDIKIQ